MTCYCKYCKNIKTQLHNIYHKNKNATETNRGIFVKNKKVYTLRDGLEEVFRQLH